MDLFKLYVILLCALLVKCNNTQVYRGLDRKIIEKGEVDEICATRPCITKCCPRKKFISPYEDYSKCLTNKFNKHVNNYTIDFDFSVVEVYSIDRTHRYIEKTAKNVSQEPYFIIHNNIYQDPNSYNIPEDQWRFHLIEDGSLAQHVPNRYNRYVITKPFKFCVDVMVDLENKTGKVVYKISMMEETQETREGSIKLIFTAITMLISFFFLLLTLLVYLLLPHLRTIGGKILMALVSTLALSYLVKAILNLVVMSRKHNDTFCSGIVTVFYFAILSSFFWMNVMSFNLFWTLRGTRKCREIHRRGETHKFIMYCLYAYGTPLLLTVAASVIDNVEVGPDVIKPFFSTCQDNREELALYMFIPMGILIFTNCLLFILTAYNIWLTKKAVHQSQDSSNTKKNDNSLRLYLKLSVIMGASWILETIQFTIDLPLWSYVIVNAYNVLIGVAIFFLFVFKKKILCNLCKRFNIKSRYVDDMQSKSQYSRTETSRTPGSTKSNTSRKYNKSPECEKKRMVSISETCIE